MLISSYGLFVGISIKLCIVIKTREAYLKRRDVWMLFALYWHIVIYWMWVILKTGLLGKEEICQIRIFKNVWIGELLMRIRCLYFLRLQFNIFHILFQIIAHCLSLRKEMTMSDMKGILSLKLGWFWRIHLARRYNTFRTIQ